MSIQILDIKNTNFAIEAMKIILEMTDILLYYQ